MTRTQKLSVGSLATALVLVGIGAFTRGSGSGFGCRDSWPLCEDGALGGLLPRWEFHMVVEWTHRWVAAIVIGLLIALAIHARRRHAAERRLYVPAAIAVIAVLVQAGLGAAVVKTGLDVDLVSVHLGVAMILMGLLAAIAVNSFFIGSRGEPDATTAWSRLLWGGALGVYAVIVLGSLVHNRYVPGWPITDAGLIPTGADTTTQLHVGHRAVVAVVFVALTYLAMRAGRAGRPRPETSLVHTGFALYTVNIGLGAAHVFTEVSAAGLIVAHLMVATASWAALVAAAVLARRNGEVAASSAPDRSPVEVPA
ncbi:MAG: COX15/CtaA family protein [Actinobacteria bacterium]|nr:COX15/CtaA family protein [Actinomycetota bacterium]